MTVAQPLLDVSITAIETGWRVTTVHRTDGGGIKPIVQEIKTLDRALAYVRQLAGKHGSEYK